MNRESGNSKTGNNTSLNSDKQLYVYLKKQELKEKLYKYDCDVNIWVQLNQKNNVDNDNGNYNAEFEIK